MGFKDGVETLSTDGKRRRAFLPGPRRARAHGGQLLRDLSELPADAASRLHDDDHDLAAGLRPHAGSSPNGISIPTRWRSPDFVFEDAVEFWDRTNREDWAISEQSYLGISSRGYQPGPYSERERQLWEFDQFVLARRLDQSPDEDQDRVDSTTRHEGQVRQRGARAARHSRRPRAAARSWRASPSSRSNGSIRRCRPDAAFASSPNRSTVRR